MKLKLRSILGFVAKAGNPILNLLGVKRGTVAAKAADAAEIVDKALPAAEDPPRKG